MKKPKPPQTNENKLVSTHIFLEKGKFFSGLVIIGVFVLILILNKFLQMDVSGNVIGFGIVGGAILASSSKIKSFKDIINQS